MPSNFFDEFFGPERRLFLLAAIRVALSEDGPDVTSQSIFDPTDTAQAQIVAKGPAVVCGLPLIEMVLEFGGEGDCRVLENVDEGDEVSAGTMLAAIEGPAAKLLKAERIIMNFLCHMSGIATLTRQYVRALDDYETILLDTRKTLPGLRYPEKYAVRVGGGQNHRMHLSDMLMIKDNHVDRAGSITKAVERVRGANDPCPPLEVECRDLEQVREAVGLKVDRIMLDNMDEEKLREALAAIPESIESEVSGGVSLENLAAIGKLGPDYVSVGRLTHSAPFADMSMRLISL